jgi:lipoic acid synthetase
MAGERKVSQPKPPWIRARLSAAPEVRETRELVRRLELHTVCEEAACPNLGECWARKHAAVMILGGVCTRACGFCNVATGRPGPVDPEEPRRLSEAVRDLGLAHVVITSVDRDDLPDGGAGQFIACIQAVRHLCPETSVEVLTPDFRHKPGAALAVSDARPDVFAHNLETVPRLYPGIRPAADHDYSLALLARVKQRQPDLFTKSGIMLGLGEETGEVLRLMDDVRAADVDIFTVGQYLRPTAAHAPVARYLDPSEFDDYARAARDRGFAHVSSSPLARSSYRAAEDFVSLRAARRGGRGL